MLVPDRRQAIIDYLQEKHSASVAELSRMFFVSETSIRRDLTILERSGFVHKTYGGVVLMQGENSLLALDARRETEKEAKHIIARKAAGLIHNGDVIFLDSSSTSLAMVPFLPHFTSLSVITNGAKIAVALAEHPHIRVYSTGGLMTPNIFSYHGAIALQTLSAMHADRLFVSPKAVDLGRGAYCVDEEEAAIRRMMIDNSNETILLCAARKLGSRATFHLCGFDEIGVFVCDTTPDADWQACFDAHNIICL